MADNTSQTGTDTIASDDIGGVKYQRIKLTWGVDGSAVDASATNPLPVTSTISSIPAAADTTDSIAAALQINKVKSGLVDVVPGRAFLNVAASQPNAVLKTPTSGKILVILAAVLSPVGTASAVTFNSWDGSTGTAMSPALTPPFQLAFNPAGWFTSASGSGLSVATGAGSTTGIAVVYALV
jgi:hypothetical protein